MKSQSLLLIFIMLSFMAGCVAPIRNETAFDDEYKIPSITSKQNFFSTYALNEFLLIKIAWRASPIFLSSDLDEGLKQHLTPVNRSPVLTMPYILSQIALKDSVDIHGLSEKMLPVIISANSIWSDYKKKLVITSARDGKHCRNSLHYSGLALDLRTRDLSASQKITVKKDLSLALGEKFTVLLERDHIHVELDEIRVKGIIQIVAKN